MRMPEVLSPIEAQALSHGRLTATRDLAPSLLFVHGGFHGAWCWDPTLTFLAERGVGSAAIDLRGHGGLPQDDAFKDEGVDAMVEDIVEAARVLRHGIVLVGHSLGALLALRAIEDVSCRGLILLAPAAPADVKTLHTLPLFPSDRVVQPPGESRARKWFLPGAGSIDISSYLSRLCPESPKLLNECFHQGITVAANRLPARILCLSGEADDSPLHPRGQDEAVALRLGARLHVVPRSGHCLMFDDGWRQTAQTIFDFLET